MACLRQLRDDSGFTMLELAIVIFVAGVLFAGAAALAIPLMTTARNLETRQKIENIARAIDHYARRNYRLPCPAEPDAGVTVQPHGYERGSGATGSAIPGNCSLLPGNWVGVVPFRTLGIPEDFARDSWGRYITYAISPGFSQDVTADNFPVHRRCRTADWFAARIIYEDEVVDQMTGAPPAQSLMPRNARKARFCCSGVLTAGDLQILDVNGLPQVAAARQTAAASYDRAAVTYPNPMAPNVQVPQNDRVTAPAYILISHGRNGLGAPLADGTRSSLQGATASERINANRTRRYVEIPKMYRSGRERNYDDVLLWRTQDMIFASAAESCSLP